MAVDDGPSGPTAQAPANPAPAPRRPPAAQPGGRGEALPGQSPDVGAAAEQDIGAQCVGGERKARVSDVELMRAHLDGDKQAFNEIVRRHQLSLWLTALRVLCDHDDAQDAVQVALLRAFRSARTFRGESEVGPWLRTITENASRTAARQRATHAHRTTALPDGRDIGTFDAQLTSPEEVVLERSLVLEHLAAIPEPHRHTFLLVKLGGLSYAEAAAVEHVEIGTIRSRVSRASAALATHRAELREAGNL